MSVSGWLLRGCEGEGMSEMIGLLSLLARRLEEIENERHMCFASSLRERDLFRLNRNAIVETVDNQGSYQIAGTIMEFRKSSALKIYSTYCRSRR